MAFEQKPNTGSLFVNDRKEKETHPDLNGSLNINGVEYFLSAWQKTSKGGAQLYSLSVKPKEERSGKPAQPAAKPLLGQADGDIPDDRW